MSSIEIRKELHNYIDNSTDDIITAVYALLKTYNNDNCEAVDLKEYNSDIDEAMKEMDSGDFVSHDDVKKMLLK